MRRRAPQPARRPGRVARASGPLALLAGLLVGACLAQPPAVRALDPAPAAPSPPDPWPLERSVPVRLAAAEGSIELTLESDRGDRAHLLRQGSGVVRDGGPAAPWQRLELPAGATAWRCREREYPGPVLVEPGAAGGLRVTALLELEDYVEGVVAAELVLWDAPAALLEAQAVAARSYAVANLDARALAGRAYLHDSVLDQAFRGRFRPDAASRSRGVDRRLSAAVARTRGQVLSFDGQVLDARFHAACGGATADARDVFETAAPAGHRPVACPPCAAARARVVAARARGAEPEPADADLAWSFTASADELADLARGLGLGERLRSLSPTRIDGGGRWLEADLTGDRGRRRVTLGVLRRELGWNRLRSAVILTTWPRPGATLDGGLRFDGLGFGHGAGLCQRGAERLAREGADAGQILARYYPDARVTPWRGTAR